MFKNGNIPWNKGKKNCFSPETISKISKNHRDISGDKNPAKKPGIGEKISKALKGRKFSEEHKQKLSKPKSQQAKIKMSKNHADFSGKNNPMYGKTPIHHNGFYYDSPLQGKIYLRSSYELAYVKYLDSIGELWYYEIETFDLGSTTYTPDFFLPRIDKFIEIKGYMFPCRKIKIDKFLEQYPWDLEILYKQDLIKLGIEL